MSAEALLSTVAQTEPDTLVLAFKEPHYLHAMAEVIAATVHAREKDYDHARAALPTSPKEGEGSPQGHQARLQGALSPTSGSQASLAGRATATFNADSLTSVEVQGVCL